MATQAQIQKFITKVAPLVQKYAKQYGYKVASPIIAQACLESGYGISSLAAKYHNYFGLKCGSSWKGKSVNLMTKEEYTPGVHTTIRDNFRVYDSMEEGVKGYFEFISYSRYANLKNAKTAKEYLTYIKADGYATSSTYVQSNMALVTKYKLEKYDDFALKEETKKIVEDIIPKKKTNEEIAKEVIDGKWGAGVKRKKLLRKAGYDYATIQNIVNKMLKK